MSHADQPAPEGQPPQRKAKAQLRRERSADALSPNGRADAAAPGASDPWARASHVALVGLFAVALLWCAYVARPVIVPVLLAWVIATVVLPIVTGMVQNRIPRAIAAVLVTLALALVIMSLLALLSMPATFWLGRATELGEVIRQKLQSMSQPLSVLDDIRKVLNTIGTEAGPSLKVEQAAPTVVTTIFAVLTPAVSQFILFIGALIFYLVYQTRLRNTVVYLFSEREARLKALRILSDVDENMTRYFGAFTLINLGLGTVTVLLTWAVGLPNPLLWGVLAAVFNYVPYIGPSIVVATLAVVGLLSFPTLAEAMLAPSIYVAIVTVEGHFLTPALMGRQLELNPFAVFLAVAFCTWLWGPMGAFLAVPLLMALTVTLGHVFAEEKPQLPE
jgi:predicted PurR-regulated permease PerM